MAQYYLVEEQNLSALPWTEKAQRMGFLDFLRSVQNDPPALPRDEAVRVDGIEDVLLAARPEMNERAREIHVRDGNVPKHHVIQSARNQTGVATQAHGSAHAPHAGTRTEAQEGFDRKFVTLTRAIDELRRESKDERFVIFTQYLETLAFLREELAKTYGAEKIAVIRGGPLDEKIAAVEKFWSADGARFLIGTSAGGEGINLQVGRILFNYDLPWNPMPVEQRIGRIHRYGQQDTCQV